MDAQASEQHHGHEEVDGGHDIHRRFQRRNIAPSHDVFRRVSDDVIIDAGLADKRLDYDVIGTDFDLFENTTTKPVTARALPR